MTRPEDFDPAESPVPPACRATADRLQSVLDGEFTAAAIEDDPHLAACAACRERIAAARLLLSVLAAPPEAVALPPVRIDAILSAVREDRFARLRRRTYAVAAAACVAFVGSALLLGWLTRPPREPGDPLGPFQPGVASSNPTPESAPEPRRIRIGDELSKAGQALKGSSKPLTEPAAAAPELLAKLTDTLTRPGLPAPQFEPARLGELSDAARTGLEPVTGTAQKAFARLLRDVGSVSVKPKS